MQNLQTALRLLNLPTELGAINGQINKRTTKTLVENCLMDYTKMVKNNTTGKFEPTITYSYVIESAESLFGAYPLNLAAAHVHSSGMDIVKMDSTGFIFYRPFQEIVINETQNSWVGWTEVSIVPTATGYDYNFYYEQGFNSYFGVYYPHDENITWRSLLRKTYIKTTSTPNPTRFSKSYPKYTIAELKKKTGFTDRQLAEAFGTTWHVEFKSHDTHCLNIASDIVVIGDEIVKGEAYINGMLSRNIMYTTLISSYGKLLPDFVCRWKLYNDQFTKTGTNVFGTAWDKTIPSNADTSLNLQRGTSVAYDSLTNTLTYPPNSRLVFDYEFLPAQGKNETNGSQLYLDTMTKEPFI